MDFTPQQAVTTLQQNAISMQKLASEIYELRVLHNVAKLALARKEYEARQKYFKKEVDIRASELRDYLKWETYEELAKEQELAAQIKLKTEALHTLEELTNINKFVEKLSLLETNL